MGIEAFPQHIRDKVAVLPEKPGVYKYYDKSEKLLYIGKARNLKKRVSSYFNKNKDDNRRIMLMVQKIDQIDYTVVNSEYDALLLENSLIKKHQPRYNVDLKDSKTYPYLVVTNERFPRVFPTRTVVRDGSEYFGPYPSARIMKVIMDLIRQLYPIRTCKYDLSEKNIAAGKFRVCLEYHINLCKGPCEGLQSEPDYMANIQQIREILKGNTAQVLRQLKAMMKEASEGMQFEKAEDYRKKINTLQNFQAKSTVVNGSIISTYTLEFSQKVDEDERDILLMAINEIREQFQSTAREVIVPFEIDLEGFGLTFTVPQKGDKKKLLELSRKNAFYHYQDRLQQSRKQMPQSERNRQFLEQVRKDLDMNELPHHIEGFDNSNIQGTQPVSAMVCFRDGQPSKKEYRHYNIKTVEGPDDYSSMTEVVYRRYRRLLDEEQPLPQLVVIDGGKGQLHAAYKSLQDLGIDDQVAIIGIAKRLEEIYKPDDPYPLAIDKKSETNKLIQRIRDEAHRFGVTHHRKRRKNRTLQSELEQIPGIGKTSEEELAKVVGESRAQKVHAYFQGSQAASSASE
jgi:excinuclease ABC subunit C